MAGDELRPRAGLLERASGDVVELRFVPSENAGEFLAVTVDGDRVALEPGDLVSIDMLGPGQSVVVVRAT